MKCTICGHGLRQVTVGGITVDVCNEGCGGIWFDNFEMKKVDERHESAGETLLDVRKGQDVTVDHQKRYSCPRCTNRLMMRHFYSVKQKVEVDECPQCGGHWLDAGELGRIRKLFPDEEERRKAFEAYFEEVFGKQLAKMKKESGEKLRKARRIAHLFRFICPSYYIPGKQEGGAF
jgi:hypothetical protein